MPNLISFPFFLLLLLFWWKYAFTFWQILVCLNLSMECPRVSNEMPSTWLLIVVLLAWGTYLYCELMLRYKFTLKQLGLTVNIKFCFQLKFIVGHFFFIGAGLGRYEYLQLKHWLDCMRFKTFNIQLEKTENRLQWGSFIEQSFSDKQSLKNALEGVCTILIHAQICIHVNLKNKPFSGRHYYFALPSIHPSTFHCPIQHHEGFRVCPCDHRVRDRAHPEHVANFL